MFDWSELIIENCSTKNELLSKIEESTTTGSDSHEHKNNGFVGQINYL